MPESHERFTIRGLMVLVAAVAILMSLPGGWAVLGGMASFSCLGSAAVVPAEVRGRRRLAAVGFWVPAILINFLYAASCMAPSAYLIDPVSGHVGLMIDPRPNGPTGFVRTLPGAPPGSRDPIIGSDLYAEPGGGWSYGEKD